MFSFDKVSLVLLYDTGRLILTNPGISFQHDLGFAIPRCMLFDKLFGLDWDILIFAKVVQNFEDIFILKLNRSGSVQ